MTISTDSQLGLRFIHNNETKIQGLKILEKNILELKDGVVDQLKTLEKRKTILEDFEFAHKNGQTINEETITEELAKYVIPQNLETHLNETHSFCTIDHMFCREKYPIKYFLIQQTVYKAAELIKIGENFTGRTLKDIKFGDYVYLLGKHKMIKFIVVERGIKGIYFDDKENYIFEWGIEMESGEYFFTPGYQQDFSIIMQLLTFIELGDIEVRMIEGLKTNGTKNKTDKIYNASNNTVFVVDSSWNQILIRTEGFAVRGHFKLQPCGPQGKDRKLIWINAFEKNGYTRKPKAEIIK